MSIATAFADQLADTYRKRPIDNYGRKRILCAFNYVNRTGGTLPDGTIIDLGYLPPGQMRMLTRESWFRCPVAAGAARVLDIGFQPYQSKYNPNPQALEAENLAALVAAKDVSAIVAAFNPDVANDLFVDEFSMGSIRVSAQITGGTVPSLWQLEGYISGVVD